MSQSHAGESNPEMRAQSINGASGRTRDVASALAWRCVCGAANIGTIVCGQCSLAYDPKSGLLFRQVTKRQPLRKNTIALAVVAVLCVGGIAFGVGSQTQSEPAESRVITVRQAPPQDPGVDAPAPQPEPIQSPAAQPVVTP